MNKLIKNELIKIFKKRSFAIMIIIILVAIIISSCITKFAPKNRRDLDAYIANYESILKEYSPDKPENVSTYIELKTELDSLKLQKQYGEETWQGTVIKQEMPAILMQMNSSLYGVGKDENKYNEFKKEYDKMIEKLDGNDWKYFAHTEKEEIANSLTDLRKQKEDTIDKAKLKELEYTEKTLETKEKIINWRLDKDISYAKSAFNTKLLDYESYKGELLNLEEIKDQNSQTKAEYNNILAEIKTIEYSIENMVDYAEGDDLRGTILSFAKKNYMYIIIVAVMVAGTIVSDEFSKGTIKLLLVRPYSRTKILIAKFIAALIAMLCTTIAIFTFQFIVSSLLYGFNGLNIPAVVYNLNTNSIQEMSILSYAGITLLAIMPEIIITMVISFMLSTVFNSSTLGIIIAILGSMSTEIINMASLQLNLEWMRFFITPNWDLTQYLFGGLSSFSKTSLPFSIVVDILYIIIMMVPTIYIFKKRNIKNI